MGKDWDKALPPIEIFKECLRVLKPGAFAFFMCSPRQDLMSRMIVRLEDAGFNVGFSPMFWAYASGFPKSVNISKAIDKKLGCEREVVGKGTAGLGRNKPAHEGRFKDNYKITAPSSEPAKRFDGAFGGFQPKPSTEVILVAMKNLTEKTFVAQALKNGHGVTWLGDCKIPIDKGTESDKRITTGKNNVSRGKHKECTVNIAPDGNDGQMFNPSGRFAANLWVEDDVLDDGKTYISKYAPSKTPLKNSIFLGEKYGNDRMEQCNEFVGDSGSFSRYFSLDAWFANMVSKLPANVQKTFPYLIVPKPSQAEKNRGCGIVGGNIHSTVKPIKIPSLLITMASRPGDIILDPFVGSGTTCCAAKMLDRKYIGIDIKEEHCEIARARLEAIGTQLSLFEQKP